MNRTQALQKLRKMILDGLTKPPGPHPRVALAPDTLSSKPQLITINKLGLITTNSQPGGVGGGQIQRAYLNGLATKEVAYRLYELNKQNLVVTIRPCNWPEPYFSRYDNRVVVTQEKSNKEFCTFTGPFTYHHIGCGFFPKRASQALKNHLYAVSIVDPVWNRKATNPKTGLWNKVIKALKAD